MATGDFKPTCECCNGSGYYGDNGPGIKGNREYQRCDQCAVEPPVLDELDTFRLQLAAANERVTALEAKVAVFEQGLRGEKISAAYLQWPGAKTYEQAQRYMTTKGFIPQELYEVDVAREQKKAIAANERAGRLEAEKDELRKDWPIVAANVKNELRHHELMAYSTFNSILGGS